MSGRLAGSAWSPCSVHAVATSSRACVWAGCWWPPSAWLRCGHGLTTFVCDACCWPKALALVPRPPLPPYCMAAPHAALLVSSHATTHGAVPHPPTLPAVVAFVPSRTTHLPSPSSMSYIVYCIAMPCCCVHMAARRHTFNGSVQALNDAPLVPRSCGHIPVLPCLVGSWLGHLCRGRFP